MKVYSGIPYVYIIMNRTTRLKYLGVRYANGCHPNDLWNKYFTSSKLVHKLIKEYGKDDFYVKIIKKFPNDPEKAILKEAQYFKFIKKRNDYLNICYSSGFQDLRKNSIAGKVGGKIAKSRKVGIFSDYEKRKYYASLGGKASWVSGNNKEFLYWASPEGRKKRSSLGGKMGCFTKKCITRIFSCDEQQAEVILKQQQSNRGKKGGPKNKGFIWINNKKKSFKYTKKQQNEIPLNIFLELNEEYTIGRIDLEDIICPHCKKEGKPGPMTRHHFDNCKKKEIL
jgi:hypothetical protein